MKKKINRSLAAVILASGSSNRMKSNVPKQYLTLNSKTVLETNILKFLSSKYVNLVIVVVSKKHIKYYSDIKAKYNNVIFLHGSNARQKSAFNALKYLSNLSYRYVLIHDAARPFLSNNLIFKLYSKIIKHDTAVIPITKATDSIKLYSKDVVVKNINREKICLAQTPQIFNFEILYSAYLKNKNILSNYTDDAEIFSQTKKKIYVIKGEYTNIKITYAHDWVNQNKMNNFTIKVGHGFDTHKLVKGNQIKLFGINIPHKYKLLGHSDADVGIHAIIDALLGACSLGDIGKHFPDTNQKYKSINSLILLKNIKNLIKNQKSEISHLDCTLVAEKPKIIEFNDTMRCKVAETLDIEKENISIKATTTEGLGFTGKEKGISCYCIATVKKFIVT